MELSAEDALRLNVLLANPLQAVRIDESSMTVHALSEDGEASVKLNPRGRDDQYLKRVRELLSAQILGSPGGYPVFLRRWTRMGQARDDSLEQLLLLGEPEAVVAVVHAAGLTDEIARRAWWAMPVADNARRMLEKADIVRGSMG
ncbi:MAG TPA: sulfur reduction protein DsrS, partial [Gammaproteobacteria bacterium]|nr:sulfur reduction protein DsrS [Gammaproteobacteria bacterium]